MLKILIIGLLSAIIVSLVYGLAFLVKDDRDSKRMANALTVRIVLSVALFVVLLIAWYTGDLQPHGLVPQ